MKERLLITIVFMAILFPYSYYKPTVKEEVNDYITISDWKGWKNSHDYKLWK